MNKFVASGSFLYIDCAVAATVMVEDNSIISIPFAANRTESNSSKCSTFDPRHHHMMMSQYLRSLRSVGKCFIFCASVKMELKSALFIFMFNFALRPLKKVKCSSFSFSSADERMRSETAASLEFPSQF